MTIQTLLIQSVGQGGANQAADVRIVQHLLNDWLAKEGRIKLATDGIAGPKTHAAILAFQKSQARMPDGRVDAGGPTLRALWDAHLAGLRDLLDLSRIADHVNPGAVRGASLTSPDMAALLDNYMAAFRKSI